MSLRNPTLLRSPVNIGLGGRTQEVPLHWSMHVPIVDNLQGHAPFIYAQFQGKPMSIDGSYIPFRVELSQKFLLSRGESYINFNLWSDVHVYTGDKIANYINWQVSIDGAEATPIGLLPEKGDQSFSIKITSEVNAMATLTITYAAKYGNSNGSMKVKSIDHGKTAEFPVKGQINVPATEPPVTLQRNSVDLWRMLVPAPGVVTLLSSQEFVWSEPGPSGQTRIRKNEHTEMLWRDGDWIMRGWDDSAWLDGQPSLYVPSVKAYHDQGGDYGQPWAPVFAYVGQSWSSPPTYVTHYHRQTGAVLRRGVMDNHYRLARIEDNWKGLGVPVAVIEWRAGDGDKPTPDEVYYLGEELGYVGWGEGGVKNHYLRHASLSEVNQHGKRDPIHLAWSLANVIPSTLQKKPVPNEDAGGNKKLDAIFAHIRAIEVLLRQIADE